MWKFENGEWIFISPSACFADGDGGDGGGSDEDGGSGGDGGGDGGSGAGDAASGNEGGGQGGGDGLLANADKGKAAGNEGEVTTDPETGRPSNVPEQFWNKDERTVNTDALLKSWGDTKTAHDKAVNDLKAAQSKNGTVPEKPEDYLTDDIVKDGVIPPPEGAENIGPIAADDPGLQAFLQSAHKHGVTAEAVAGILADMTLVADPHVAKPFDEAAELAKLGDQGPQMAGTVKVWVDGLAEKNIMPKDMHDAAMRFGKTADGVKVLNFFRELSGAPNIPVFDTPGGEALPTRDQWYANMPDARKEPDKYAEWQKQGEQLFGTGNTGRIEGGLGMPSSHSALSSSRETKRG